ncbi:MAG: hypothetical protein ABEJ79_03770 [Halolamina sp.]
MTADGSGGSDDSGDSADSDSNEPNRDLAGSDGDERDADPPWHLTDDEVAGIVDAFNALEPSELRRALSELAYRQGIAVDADDPSVERTVTRALGDFRLLTVDGAAVEGSPDAESDDDSPAEYLVVGPSAFPELPAGGDDLPHILDVDRRAVDRDVVAETAAARVREEAEAVLSGGGADADADPGRAATLREVTYDVESLGGGVDLRPLRERLDGRDPATTSPDDGL